MKGMELPSQEKIRTLREKENAQILRNIRNRHHQTSGDERKNFKRVSQKNKKATQNQTK